MASVRILWRANALLGESPCWIAQEEALYWVDIRSPSLHRYRPSDSSKASWRLPDLVGCVVPGRKGGLLLALRTGLFETPFPTAGQPLCLEKIKDFPEQEGTSRLRFNDGKMAPDGSFWVGTMDDLEEEPIGAWYRLMPSGEMRQVARGFMVTNGPAFDPFRGRVYLTDSARRTIYYSKNWNADNIMESAEVFREFDPSEGCPDGMTVDHDGRLWVAFWDGWCVRALDPETAETITKVKLPVQRPTSCALGGESGSTLFVTSASIGLDGGRASATVDGALLSFEIDATVPSA